MSTANPTYSLLALLPAGVLPSRTIMDGLAAAYAANLFQPLSTAQIVAITGPAVTFPSTLPRAADPDCGQAAYGFDLVAAA